MKKGKTYCLDCRLLELRRGADGDAIYWCVEKKASLGPSVLGRPSCSEFKYWRSWIEKR